ncbi:MAG: hypothetical protein ACFE9S_01770 [Candidatus Hermodarchaeota archaeon]
MNDIVLYFLIFLIIFRFLGFLISFEFFYDTKDNKFIFFMFCWVSWIIAALFPILSDLTEINNIKELLLILNPLFASIGGFFYIWGIIKFIINIQFKFMMIVLISIIVIPTFLYFVISYTLSSLVLNIILSFLIISASILIPIKKKNLKKYIGKSIRWVYLLIVTYVIYLILSIYIYTYGEGFGVYNAENILLILINYIPAIAITIIMFVLLVHFQFSLSTREKNELKDKYSHNFGNILQVIYSASDLIMEISKLELQEKNKLDLIIKKCEEASELIKEIKKI